MFPDPDEAGFDESTLPEGVTAEDLRDTREKYATIFHPQYGTVGNVEGLHRRNLANLLPHDDKPKLHGIKITVVGHGFRKFAEDSFNASFSSLRSTRN